MMCRHVLSVVLAVAGTVSAAFGSEVETDSLKPYPLFRPVPAHLEDGKRHLQLVPSIAVTRGGRLWVTWIAGGRCEDDDNALVLVTSGDGGKSWSKPLLAIDQPGPLRVLDPGVWTDPEGRVWLFWGQTWSFWDGRCGLWARQAVDPENPATEWANPHRLCDGYMKNKPTILKDGRWLLPVEVMAQMGPVCGTEFGLKPNEGPQAHPMPQYRSGVNVFVSSDKGEHVAFFSQAKYPNGAKDYPEQMFVERRDGSIWLLVRTEYGIGESVSTDGGRTWSDVSPSSIPAPNSRFHISRLSSGALILVKNGPIDRKTDRIDIMAYVSDDDGKTWKGGLLLDGRTDVSYPDAVLDSHGVIHVVTDHDRYKAGEIMYHRITEADIRAGRLVTEGSAVSVVINRCQP